MVQGRSTGVLEMKMKDLKIGIMWALYKMLVPSLKATQLLMP